MKQRLSFARIVAALALLLALPLAALAQDAIIFYEEPCASCDDGEWMTLYLSLIQDLRGDHADGVQLVNTFQSGTERLRDLLGDRASGLELPVVVFPDGHFLSGETAFRNDLRAAYAAWRGIALPAEDPAIPMATEAPRAASACVTSAKDDGGDAVWFICAPYCESCLAAEKALDGLPSGIAILTVNASGDAALARALFERYGVPEEKRIAPSAFIGERALIGVQEIEENLANLIANGEATRTLRPRTARSFAPWAIALVSAALFLAAAAYILRKKKRRVGK